MGAFGDPGGHRRARSTELSVRRVPEWISERDRRSCGRASIDNLGQLTRSSNLRGNFGLNADEKKQLVETIKCK